MNTLMRKIADTTDYGRYHVCQCRKRTSRINTRESKMHQMPRLWRRNHDGSSLSADGWSHRKPHRFTQRASWPTQAWFGNTASGGAPNWRKFSWTGFAEGCWDKRCTEQKLNLDKPTINNLKTSGFCLTFRLQLLKNMLNIKSLRVSRGEIDLTSWNVLSI